MCKILCVKGIVYDAIAIDKATTAMPPLYQLTLSEVFRLQEKVIGIPVCIEHNNVVKGGKVTGSVLECTRVGTTRWVVDIQIIDPDPELVKALSDEHGTRTLDGLSLSHSPSTMTPLEVSLCAVGARPGTKILDVCAASQSCRQLIGDIRWQPTGLHGTNTQDKINAHAPSSKQQIGQMDDTKTTNIPGKESGKLALALDALQASELALAEIKTQRDNLIKDSQTKIHELKVKAVADQARLKETWERKDMQRAMCKLLEGKTEKTRATFAALIDNIPFDQLNTVRGLINTVVEESNTSSRDTSSNRYQFDTVQSQIVPDERRKRDDVEQSDESRKRQRVSPSRDFDNHSRRDDQGDPGSNVNCSLSIEKDKMEDRREFDAKYGPELDKQIPGGRSKSHPLR
jgi:hypothetical protein